MSVKGIIMFLGMNNTRLERKVLIILDFENGFLPTYLPQCGAGTISHIEAEIIHFKDILMRLSIIFLTFSGVKLKVFVS